MAEQTSTCTFQHPGLAALDRPVFRLTEGDRVPALAISLDGSDAVLPLRTVAKLFAIAPDSGDAHLLRLIGESLKFVTSLHLGDRLPEEVLSGEASWQPSSYHRQIATARLQLQLVDWIGAGEGQDKQITPQMLVAAVEDPAIRPRVQEALRRAADSLGLAGGSGAVATLLEELAGELSYIEALRERLLVRVQAMARRLARQLQEIGPLAPNRRETLFQVGRLASIGLGKIAGRFEEVDAQTGEIIAALRNLERQRSFLRPNRDWIYVTQIAWDPLLREWEALPSACSDERFWKVVDHLYRFLAPRYMAVQEWQQMQMSSTGCERDRAVLTW